MPSAGERALAALTQVNNIGFPEFTAKLINDTVDAIVGATIRQLKSYTELVQELEAGLEAFRSKAVTTEAVQQYMRDAFPDSGDESAVMAGKSYDRALYEQIINRVGPVSGLADPGTGTRTFSTADVQAVESRVRVTLNTAAETSFNQLRTMVQMGYARVVFNEGRIRTKLTFEVESNDSRQRNTTDIAQQSFQASAGMKGGILGSILGISGSTSYWSMRVRTVSTRAVEADRVRGDILGEVEINFGTQTFPAVEVAPAAPAEVDSPT